MTKSASPKRMMASPIEDEPESEDPINEVEENEVPNLSEMTKAELLSFASENGIEGVNGSMKKADILNTIEESMEG